MQISLRHLQQIEALSRHRNFARAAMELNISQPGLSLSIRNLEDQLGFKLFDRNAREVSPTAFGKHALKLGNSILSDARRLERELKMLADLESGLIRIGLGPLAAEVFLSKTLGRLGADYPGFTVRTTVEWVPALLSRLMSGELDLVVCDTRYVTNPDDLMITDLPNYPACYVSRPAHPLSKNKRVTCKDIFNYPIATPNLPAPIIHSLSRLSGFKFTKMEDFPNGLIEAPYHLLAETIIRCDAVGIGIQPVFHKGIQEGKLYLLPLQTPELTSQYGLISLKRYSLSPAALIFQKYIVDTAQELLAAFPT